MNKHVLNKNYDISGNELPRMAFHISAARILPLGSFAGGAGWKCLLALFLTHYAGKPVYYILLRAQPAVLFMHRLRIRFSKR